MKKKQKIYKNSVEKSYTKRLNNIGMLRELPIYDKFCIAKTLKAFKGYARSYSTQILDSKDPSVQLTISRPSTKCFFKDLSGETKGFKYLITPKRNLHSSVCLNVKELLA